MLIGEDRSHLFGCSEIEKERVCVNKQKYSQASWPLTLADWQWFRNLGHTLALEILPFS